MNLKFFFPDIPNNDLWYIMKKVQSIYNNIENDVVNLCPQLFQDTSDQYIIKQQIFNLIITIQVQYKNIDLVQLILSLHQWRNSIIYHKFQQNIFHKIVTLFKYLYQHNTLIIKSDINQYFDINDITKVFDDSLIEQLDTLIGQNAVFNHNSSETYQQIQQIINQNIKQVIERINTDYQQQLSIENVIFILIISISNFRKCFVNDIIENSISLLSQNQFSDVFKHALLNTIHKFNLLGKIIFDSNVQGIEQILTHPLYHKLIQKVQTWNYLQKTQITLQSVIYFAILTDSLVKNLQVILFNLGKKINVYNKTYKYLKQFIQFTSFKNFTAQAKHTILNDLKQKVYKVHFNNILSIFDIIQRIENMQLIKFAKMFNFKIQHQVDQFLSDFQYGQQYDAVISTQSQVYNTAMIYQLARFWQIKINLADNIQNKFYIEENVINILFQAIQSGLGYIQSYNDLLLIKRVYDGKLYSVTSITDETIENLLSELKESECDIILVTKEKVNIERFNIRNLSCQSICYTIELQLSFPLSLWKASLHRTTIENLHDCYNLVSIYSSENQYSQNNINTLRNISVFISYFDTYFAQYDTMLESILNNNNIKIVSVYDGKNIVPSMLYNNLQHLEYFQMNGIYKKLIINIDNATSYNLKWIKSYIGPIKFNGSVYDTNKLKQQLIKFQCDQCSISHDKVFADQTNGRLRFMQLQDNHNDAEYILVELFKSLMYNELLNSKSNPPRYYNILCSLKQIHMKTNAQLMVELNLTSTSDVETLVMQCGNKKPKSLTTWKQILIWTPYLKRNYVRLLFNHRDNELDFYFNNISEDNWREFIGDIENKILGVDSNYAFIVSRSADTQEVVKDYTTVDKKDAIPSVVSQLKAKKEKYDLILINYNIPDIQVLKLRYLSYYNNTGQAIDLYLEYPQLLISVALSRVTISNLGECTQLKNLCSSNNQYDEYNLTNLRTLKMLYSENDVCLSYDNGRPTSVIMVIMQVALLEYVYINTGSQISWPLRLQTNLYNLRFFYHYSKVYTSIVLDITSTFPSELQIFSSQHLAEDNEHVIDAYVQIIGSQDNVNKLRKQIALI